MKTRTIASLLLALVLTACGGHPSSFSSEVNTSSSDSASSFYSSSDLSSSQSSSDSSEVTISEAYDGYYKNLTSWSNGEDLKNQLYTILRNGYRPLTYTTPNYETNINADHSYYDFEYLDAVYTDAAISINETNKGWQREHAFCASLMCGSDTSIAVKNKGRATDFHNLFASGASANSSRRNKNYGVADKTNPNYTNRTVNNGEDGYSFDPVNFEPGNYDKGRLARAIFYMATMYSKDENDEANHLTMRGLRVVEDPVSYVQGENGAFAIGNLSTLINWNNSFAVDYLEMQHNVSVYRDVYTSDGYAQGNRNPYVDYPELVDYAFGNKKDQPGTLSSLIPSEDLLHCNEHIFSHYALKEAKRSYEPGAQISNDDYLIVKVYTDYTYETANSGYTNSLNNHVFTENDGESIDAVINAGEDTFSYRIILDPMVNCSSGIITLGAPGIDKTKVNQEQEVSWGNMKILLTIDGATNSGSASVSNISAGGVTFGSGTYPLRSLTLKTKENYTVDAAYIKAFVGNKDSSFQLTIKVGDTVLLNQTTVNNKDVGKIYGQSTNNPLTGQVSYIFTGTNSLKINTIAFNTIIA